MQLGAFLGGIGVMMIAIGMAVEALAMIGITSYRVRRALPVKSPIVLLMAGCNCFCAGALITVVGAWLAG